MKYSFFLAFAFIFLVSSFSQKVDESIEPPVKYFLEIHGKEYPMKIGEAITLPYIKNAKAILRVAPYRSFTYSGIAFDYPYKYIFESDFSTPRLKVWSIQGQNVVIMVQNYGVNIAHKHYIDAIKSQYKNYQYKVEKCFCKIKGSILQGMKIIVNMNDVVLVQEIYRLKKKKDITYLILQDTLENQKNSQEYLEMRKVFEKTFFIK